MGFLECYTSTNEYRVQWSGHNCGAVHMIKTLSQFLRHSPTLTYDSDGFVRLSEIMRFKTNLQTPAKLITLFTPIRRPDLSVRLRCTACVVQTAGSMSSETLASVQHKETHYVMTLVLGILWQHRSASIWTIKITFLMFVLMEQIQPPGEA